MNNKLKIVPYNTGKLKIGGHYVPPQRNYMTEHDEHWQNVLTGVYQYRKHRRMQFAWYVVGLTVVFILLGVLA